MALTVTTDLTNITAAESGESAGWADIGGGGASIQETDFAIQGSQSRSRAVSGAGTSKGMVYNNGANLDFSSTGAHANKLIYFWIGTFAPGLIQNLASAPGLRIRIDTGVTQGTNYWEWDIMYSNLLAAPGTDFFRVYVLDPRAPATRSAGSPSLTTLRHFGAIMTTNATAKGQNLAIDRISYGFGEIRVSGTATSAASGLDEMVDYDWNNTSNRYGVLTVKNGIVSCKGKLVIGDSVGTASTTFTAQDTIVAWEPTWYYDGTRIRPTVGYDFSGNFIGRRTTGIAHYGIDFRGNGTGSTTITFGAAVGSTTGRSGPTFIGSDSIPTDFTADNGNVGAVALYGTTFDNFSRLDMSSNSNADIMRSCTFKRCGSLDIGPVVGKNNNFINGIGGGYTFIEKFYNLEATTAEALATADPVTEWTNVVNGADWSIPTATAGYVELLGGTTRTNLTVLDDDKMGSDNHYAECIINFPSSGSGQATLGPTIANHITNQNYFWLKVDLVNDQVSLIRTSTGSDTTIAGPTAFTMDEDQDYIALIRRNGTTIEGFVSGYSAASGIHTTKLSATDSNHTGTAQRLVGLRGDALAGQTGGAPRIRTFGAGPITDNLGSIILPSAAEWDFQNANFINCTRALSWDQTGGGNYSLTNVTLSGNLVDAHVDAGGAVTVNGSSSTTPASRELLGSSTLTFNSSVTVTVTVLDRNSNPIQNASVYVQDEAGPFNNVNHIIRELTNASGIATESYTGSTPLDVVIRVRKKGYVNVSTVGTISTNGMDTTIVMDTDTAVE